MTKPRDHGDARCVVFFGAEPLCRNPFDLVGEEGVLQPAEGVVEIQGAGLSRFSIAHPMRVHSFSKPEDAIRFIGTRLVEALILDLRHIPGCASCSEKAWALLRALFPAERTLHGLRHERIIGIVDGGEQGVEAAFQLGKHHVGHVLTSPTREALLQRIDRLLTDVKPGKVAICLAGGGIEGLLYELGVLRALDAFLVQRSVVDLDMFCGISAGAILAGLLANGLGPEEISRGLDGESSLLDPVRRRDMFDPNFRELKSRLQSVGKDMLPTPLKTIHNAWRGFRDRPSGARSGQRSGTATHGVSAPSTDAPAAYWDGGNRMHSAMPSAAFAGDALRAYLLRQFTKPGMQNRFDMLRRPLYIGATDQDTSKAVVFGSEGQQHVPVHRAIRASTALIPFYAPEEIDGRYYIDGGFARTTNMGFAVEQGASLVILIDPLVPMTSTEPGFIQRQGGMFTATQGLKALVNGRFDKGIRVLQEMYPQVDFQLFRPEGDEMNLLAGSPMKYFYRRTVERRAFDATMRAIRHILPDLSRSFAHHGIAIADPDEQRERAFAPPTPFVAEDLGID